MLFTRISILPARVDISLLVAVTCYCVNCMCTKGPVMFRDGLRELETMNIKQYRGGGQ